MSVHRTDDVLAVSPLDARIREIDGLDDLESASALLGKVWERAPESRQVTVSLLRAFSMTGNYVAGAFLDETMVGAAVGFASVDGRTLHSHIAGVAQGSQARHVGFRLKQHQRTWARDRGMARVTWTFDPLVRRNAYFNLVKLSARATTYLTNFYGSMHDGLNNGDESDRLLIEWALADAPAETVTQLSPAHTPLVVVAGDGTPHALPWDGASALVPVPADIERLRVTDPGLSTAWRESVRAALVTCLSQGGSIAGFDREHGYLIDRTGAP